MPTLKKTFSGPLPARSPRSAYLFPATCTLLQQTLYTLSSPLSPPLYTLSSLSSSLQLHTLSSLSSVPYPLLSSSLQFHTFSSLPLFTDHAGGMAALDASRIAILCFIGLPAVCGFATLRPSTMADCSVRSSLSLCMVSGERPGVIAMAREVMDEDDDVGDDSENRTVCHHCTHSDDDDYANERVSDGWEQSEGSTDDTSGICQDDKRGHHATGYPSEQVQPQQEQGMR
eukprot:768038-Hanusia_phi.AAC.6